MFDPRKLIDDLLATQVPGTSTTVRGTADRAVEFARENPIATGAIAAVLLGTGTGRRVAGSALRMGGLAAIAGLAYKAYQNAQQGKESAASADGQVPAPPPGSPFDPRSAGQEQEEFALVLVRAMLAAARADGRIDDEERAHVADKLRLSGIGGDASAFILAELARPVDLDALVAAAKTDAEKTELYTASRLAITADTDAERGYLQLLAGRLGLPAALVSHVEATIADVKA